MLFEIRNLIDRGLYAQATELAFELSGQDGFMGPDPFVPAFDVNLSMGSEGEVNNYMRSVDFQTGEATVHWTDDRGVFERKMFVSRTDGLAVMLITGPAGAVDFRLGIGPRKPSDKLDARTISNSYKVFEDNISNIVTTADNKSIVFKYNFTNAYPGSIHSLESIAKVVMNDGQITEGRQTISVKGASKVLILFDLELLYDPDNSMVDDMKTVMSRLPANYENLFLKSCLRPRRTEKEKSTCYSRWKAP